jgi:anti-anti-sigma regulatory factor
LQPLILGTWVALFHVKGTCGMLKITVVEDTRRRRVIVEGKLIAPWAAELTSAYQTARTDLQDRELIVDLRSLTAIGPAGDDVLLQLMREKVKLLCGVYMKEVLKQLGVTTRDSLRDATAEYSDSEPPPTQG